MRKDETKSGRRRGRKPPHPNRDFKPSKLIHQIKIAKKITTPAAEKLYNTKET